MYYTEIVKRNNFRPYYLLGSMRSTVQFCIVFLIGCIVTEVFGDIILSRRNRNGILKAKRWPNGVIPYEWCSTCGDGATWTQEHRTLMDQAMRHIEKHTCIRFVPRINDDNYVKIVNSSKYGCSSAVGVEGGGQYVSLYAGGCWTFPIVIHELLHGVGLWHEQQRYDREDYINVIWDVVGKSNFNYFIASNNETDIYNIPYNYHSIMHYSKKSGNAIGMVTRDPNMIDVIGNELGPHELDYEKVRRIYECKGQYPTIPAPAPPTGPVCENYAEKWGLITNCAWVSSYVCTDDWMKINCKKYCNLCNTNCKDTVEYCWDRKNECGKEAWTKDYCAYTCGQCM